MKNKKIMTVKQFAEKEGISVQAVYKQVRENRVKSVKIGKVILIEDERD